MRVKNNWRYHGCRSLLHKANLPQSVVYRTRNIFEAIQRDELSKEQNESDNDYSNCDSKLAVKTCEEDSELPFENIN